MKMKTLLLACLLSLTLGGCFSLGTHKDVPIVTYQLRDDGTVTPSTQSNPRSLLLLPTTSDAFYDTTSMAFSRAPDTRGLYQFALWTERPARRLTSLLLARLDAEHAFVSVAQAGSSVKGDWLLDTRLLAFYHDAVTPPGSVRVALRAEVVDLRSRSLIARKRFDVSVPVASYDAAGAAQAFNRATGTMLDQVSRWLQALPVAGVAQQN
jgi:cholesterol transport system auxiliary component